MSHKIAFREYGHGPLVVLLHGYGGSVMHWQSVVDKLKDHYRVVVPNLSHLYMSRNRLLFSVQLELIAGFMREHFPGEKASFVGMSFGGALAWGLSLQHPSLVDRLMLLNPLMPNPVGRFRLPEMRYFFVLPMGDKAMLNLFNSPIGDAFLRRAAETFRPDRDLAAKRLARLSPIKLAFIADLVAHFSWILRNEDWNYWQLNLARIQNPTLVLTSQDDPLFLDASYRDFVSSLSVVQHIEFETGGHLLATTHGERVVSEILQFLRPPMAIRQVG